MKTKIVLWVLFLWVLFNAFSHDVNREKPVNVATIEYYRYYTIEYYNGKLDVIYVDLEKYPAMYCDSYTTHNDEGQNCILAGDDTMNEFLVMVGQK